MHGSPHRWSSNDALWALEAVCRVHRIAFDARLARHALPDPIDVDAWCEVATRCGFAPVFVERRQCTRERIAAAISRCGATCAIAIRAAADDAVPTETRIVLVDATGLAGCTTAASPTPTAWSDTDDPADWHWLAVARAPTSAWSADDAPARTPFGFRWFVPELLRHRRTWRDVIVASLLLQLFALATPVLTQVVIDKVVVHRTLDTLWVVVFALVASTLFGALLGFVRQAFVTHAGTRIDAMLGDRVFRHLLSLPLRWFEARATGQVVSRLQGVETVREFLTGAAIGLVLDVPFALVFLAVMAAYSLPLTGIAIVGLVLVAVASAIGLPRVRARLEHQMRSAARNQAYVTETIAAAPTVKSLQLEPLAGRRYGALLADYLTAAWHTRQAFNGWQVSAQGLEQAMQVAILAAGAWAVMHDPGFTVGMLVAFQMFASRLAQPVMRLVGLWQELQQAALAVRRLSDVMDAVPEPASVVPTLSAQGAVPVAFVDVRFRYAPDRPLVLDGFDLDLPAGSCTALTGASGSGKSTVARLLQGFEFRESGRVEVAGRDTRSLAADELRALLGVVPQDTVLFARSVWDNLVDGAPDADLARVVRACRIAEVHDVIEQLPAGYQTVLGERGVGLSGGQRQRIAIARALLRRPAILVFDEATSALDTDTAAAFARTVNRLRGRVTLLFIAHHLPADLQVDRVVRMPGTRRPKIEPLHPDRGLPESDFAPVGP